MQGEVLNLGGLGEEVNPEVVLSELSTEKDK